MARYRRVRSSLKKRLARSQKLGKFPPRLSTEPKKGFLDLPSELRNQIYRLVLLEEDEITLKKNGFTEAPLLLACRRVRKETIAIFYLENKWLLDAPDWDHSLHLAFIKHVRSRQSIHSIDKLITYWTNTGSYYNKANLIEFIKTSQQSKTLRPLKYERDRPAVKTAITGAFEIADRK